VEILRAGPVTEEELLDHGLFVRHAIFGESPDAPGQLKSHYAPRDAVDSSLGSVGVPSAVQATRPKDLPKLARGRDARCVARRVGRPPYSREDVRSPACLHGAIPAAPGNSPRWKILSATGDLHEAAATLFAKLRRLDEAGLDLIIAEPVPEHGLALPSWTVSARLPPNMSTDSAASAPLPPSTPDSTASTVSPAMEAQPNKVNTKAAGVVGLAVMCSRVLGSSASRSSRGFSAAGS
jgi:hypothetical protein